MSLYYKQNFISSLSIQAEVKEMLKSYFNSGSLDDLMFPIWIDHCLRKFKRAAYKITKAVLTVENHQACLPPDFKGVREAWLCATTFSVPWESPSAYYYDKDCIIDYVNQGNDRCDKCGDNCECTIGVTHKVTQTMIYQFKRTFMLRPGNMDTLKQCDDECANIGSSAPYTFDIDCGYMRVAFEDGNIYLLYYALPAEGEIPENFYVEDYIRKYLMYKCFEQLSHLVTDESANQIDRKKAEYYQMQNMAFITANTELMKPTAEEALRQTGYRARNFYNKYKLP